VSKTQCAATKPRVFDPSLPPKQCARKATHGQWCRQHAESLGGWRLLSPETSVAKMIHAINSFRWLGNNLHNSGTDTFRRLYDAALEDARDAMGDDWQRADLTKGRS